MANDQLKEFWTNVADGLYCSALYGWNLVSAEGELKIGAVVKFGAVRPNGAEVDVVITQLIGNDFVSVVVTHGDEELLNIEAGTIQFDDEQEAVDLISGVIDDNLFEVYED